MARSSREGTRRGLRGRSGGPQAVIVGLDSMQGLQLARILRRAGVRVVAIAEDRRYHTTRTNACRVVFGPTSGPGLVGLLDDLSAAFAEPPVLIPCQDHAVLTISRNRARLSGSYRFLLPDETEMETMMDKASFYEFARGMGLRVPETIVVRTPDDAREAAAKLSFPAILKPTIRTSAWMEVVGAKVARVSSADELLWTFGQLDGYPGAVVAQEWIPGGDGDLYSLNACYSAESELLASFVARKIRQWPIEAGQSSAGEACEEDRVLTEADRAFRVAGMRGLAYMEFKRHAQTGEMFAIEPNIGRPTGRSAIAEAGGVELHHTYYCIAAGLPLPERRTQGHDTAKWVHLLRDLRAARAYVQRGDLTWRRWLASLRGPKAFALWSLRDPLPFVVAIGHAIGDRVRQAVPGSRVQR